MAPSVKNVEIVAEGDKFILPKAMEGKYDEAIEWLTRKKTEEERQVALREEIKDAHPLDAMVAFHKALAEIYGWTDLRPTPGFFGGTPPVMIGIWVGHDQLLQVAFGRVAIPGVSGFLETGFEIVPVPKFIIAGQVKKKHLAKVQEIVHKVHEVLRTDSIYRGKAVKVDWTWLREFGPKAFDPTTHCPQFLDLTKVDENIVFDEDTQSALNLGLFGPIQYPEAARANRVPMKRGILLAGPYGVGKTLTALYTAKLATERGMTFIYLNSILDLPQGYEFAANYSTPRGAVLFGEDIDRTMFGTERTPQIDQILNIIDGIDSKGLEIITVLTTNHPEAVHRAMLRPGRIDTVVRMRAPSAPTVEKLIRLYGRGLIHDDVDLSQVARKLEGNIPAVIRELVEMAKMSCIVRLGGGQIEGQVNGDDILTAYRLREDYNALLNEEHKGPKFKKMEIHLPPGEVFDSDNEAYGMVRVKEESESLN